MIRKSLLGIALLAAAAAFAQNDTKPPAAGSMTECPMDAQHRAAAKADAKRMSREAMMANCPMHDKQMAAMKSDGKPMSHEAMADCPMHGEHMAAMKGDAKPMSKDAMAGCAMHEKHMAAAKGGAKPMSHDAMMANCPMHDEHMAAAKGEAKLMSHDAMMANCPMHDEHMAAGEHAAHGDAAHGAAVDHRHDTFGMSHAATHHNFRLFGDGGAIELRANDAGDSATVDAIRKHLTEITSQFNAADFSKPGFVHGQTPAGVAEMARLGKAITYTFEPLPEGGRIAIKTTDPKGVAAVHDFLKFQIVEHRTGDPAKVE